MCEKEIYNLIQQLPHVYVCVYSNLTCAVYIILPHSNVVYLPSFRLAMLSILDIEFLCTASLYTDSSGGHVTHWVIIHDAQEQQ